MDNKNEQTRLACLQIALQMYQTGLTKTATFDATSLVNSASIIYDFVLNGKDDLLQPQGA